MTEPYVPQLGRRSYRIPQAATAISPYLEEFQILLHGDLSVKYDLKKEKKKEKKREIRVIAARMSKPTVGQERRLAT